MVGTAIQIGGWTAADESVRVTAAEFLAGRVKGGSTRESVVAVEGVLMLPESLRRRLDSIRNLSRQGKRINGLFRLMLSPLLWEQAYAEIAPNRGALTKGVTDNTLDGFSFERVHSLISRISAGTYRHVRTVNVARIKRVRFQGRYTLTRGHTSRIRLVVPHDRVVRFNRRKGYGDLSRLKAIHRRYLIDSSVLEIVLAYNAEMRGLANYYRLANCAKYSLRKLHFLWQTSLLKTLSFKLRRSVNQVAYQLRIGGRLAIRVKVEGRKERLVEVFALKDLNKLPELGAAVDRSPNSMWTAGRSDVLDRLHSRKCEYCGATDVPCEVHHAHKLKDVKDAPLWQQVAAARRRKRTVLCRSCHDALHAGKLTSRERDTEMRVRRAG